MESKVYLSPIPMQEQLALNLEQAAKLVGVSVPIMLRLVNSEGFPALKVGRRWVIPLAALENWLTAQAQQRRVFDDAGGSKRGQAV